MVVTTPRAIQAWEPESAADLAYFRSVPWCAAILSRAGVRPFRSALPGAPADRGCDPLLGGFMARGADGILRHLSLLAEPGAFPDLDVDRDVGEGTTSTAITASASSSVAGEHQQHASHNGSSSGCSRNPFPQHLDLYTLGPALRGAPRTLHGGILCMLVDASCGRVGFMHRGSDRDSDSDREATGAYTAYTNTRFLRPGVMDDGAGDGTLTVLVRTQISARLSPLLRVGGGGGGGDGDGDEKEGERNKKEEGAGNGRKEKMVVLASVEAEGGKVLAVGESEVVETVWKQKGKL